MVTKVLQIPTYGTIEKPVITKTGKVSKRTKLEWGVISNECECVEITANYRGQQVSFYIKKKYLERPIEHKSWCTANMYDANGNKIMAVWKHGRYGDKRHEEPAIYNYAYKEIVEATDYCDGRVRDSYKYLVKVLF